MAGIYLHIPFCKQACSYCNFHFSTSSRLKPDVINAMCREITLRRGFLADESVDSIYLGGGTPSLLARGELESLFRAIYDNFDVSPDAEITLEANPDDLTSEVLQHLADSPVNRLSIGIQSFFDDDLRYMNRAHSAAEAEAALESCLKIGFHSLTVDLIYGTPTMHTRQWSHNLEKIAAYGVRHLSAYQLTIEPGTALATFISKGTALAPDDEQTHEQFELLMDWADKHGYEHYEISNFAQPGFRAVHNSNYWRAKAYLGIGPSAHSFDGARRTWNVANNARYLRGMQTELAIEGEELLTREDHYNELVMTGLRTSDGVQLEEIRKISEEFIEPFLLAMQEPLDRGQVVRNQDRFVLTRAGKHFADRIASNCFVTGPV